MTPGRLGVALALSQGGEGGKRAGVLKDLPVAMETSRGCSGLLAGGQGQCYVQTALRSQPVALGAGEERAYHSPACSTRAGIGQWGTHMKGLPRAQCPVPGHSHLQDHDDVGLFFEGVHALHQLGVVQAVHDADLLPDGLFLFCRICLEEFPCPDFSSFLFYKSKDLSKFSTANERRREKANVAKLPSKWGLANYSLGDKPGPPVF